MIQLPKWTLVVLALALVLGLAAPALAADTVKGKIKTVSADKNEFTLTDNGGKAWTFHMDDKARVNVNNKESKLNDLKEGEEVTVTYEKKGDQTIAKEIRCERK